MMVALRAVGDETATSADDKDGNTSVRNGMATGTAPPLKIAHGLHDGSSLLAPGLHVLISSR